MHTLNAAAAEVHTRAVVGAWEGPINMGARPPAPHPQPKGSYAQVLDHALKARLRGDASQNAASTPMKPLRLREMVPTVENLYGGPTLGHKILYNARYFSAPDVESVLGNIAQKDVDEEAIMMESLVRSGAADAELEGALG